RFREGHYFWSVMRVLPETWGPSAVMAVWLASTVALLVGWRPFISGLVCWACAVSFFNIHVGINNGGDRVRITLLLAVAFSCSGAVWGVSSVRKRGDTRPVFVHSWPLQVLFVQLAVLYFFSGWYKIISPQWRSGYVMYFVNHDLAWCTTPAYTSLAPVWVHQLSAWVTLVWELGFPVLAVMKGTRTATLALGVFFHLGTFVTLEVAHFALYAIACYAMFVPWERWRKRPAPPGEPSDGR
ncbi:MAG TPA: HTTM domain-containing protein, partial [Gemmataceae bacterium]|nr:HTTM domain-containing protein [Gemmataceae bacterium]